MGLCLAPAAVSRAQNTSTTAPPVIDVHFHAMEDSGPTAVPMCPNTSRFTASDPATKEAPIGWAQEECTPKLYPSAKGEYIKDVVADMERLNVTAVVFGTPESVRKWMDAAPKRVIPGTGFDQGLRPASARPAGAAARELRQGRVQGDGRDRAAVPGLSPSDPWVDQYFALAEELDIPVAIHMGTGGSGRANVAGPRSAAPWATRCCSRTSSRATRSCVSR